MNPNFLGRMTNGCPYKSSLGIQGIEAVRDDADSFLAFADSLDSQLGENSQRTWHGDNDFLSPQGSIKYGSIALVFFAGATRIVHGSMVLGGIVDSYYDRDGSVYNRRVTEAMAARWSTTFAAWAATMSHVYTFGHSYGGVQAVCLAEYMASLYTNTRFFCETYGTPRCVIWDRMTGAAAVQHTRNVHRLDVVSHVPYKTTEAPLASRITTTRNRDAFDASGHPCIARVFEYDGTFEQAANNTIPVQDTTLSMAGWVCYIGHLYERQHEQTTYVNTMARYALASTEGQLPSATDTSSPDIDDPTITAGADDPVIGAAPIPAVIAQQLESEEQQAAAAYFSRTGRKPARGVRELGVAGVEFLGVVSVSASGLRSAKGLAKRLNKLRRLMGPLTTDQRAEMLAALESDLEGPIGQ